MEKRLLLILFAFGIQIIALSRLYATPSTQIWNPSTDIQPVKTFHLGIDNYFSVLDNNTKPFASPVVIGVTYGLVKNLEAGVDLFEPASNPLYFNLKYGLPEKDKMPALAAGGFNFGTKQDATNYNMIYAVAAKTFKPAGRISLGYYTGNDKLLVDENGEKANSGIIASFDKSISDKVWASVDYASGKSFYGCLSFGASYAFAPNTSVILGYVIYNNDKINVNNQFTTQLDINF